jgi:adenosylhomocysteine nucleosidase
MPPDNVIQVEFRPMICILFSFRKEISTILERTDKLSVERRGNVSVYEGIFQNCSVRLIRTGMGFKEISERILSGCTAVLSTGFCGGLSPDLNAGDIVLSSEIVYISGKMIQRIMTGTISDNVYMRNPVLPVPKPLSYADALHRLGNRTDTPIHIHVGRTVTSERVLRTGEEKRGVHNYFNALSVDMEDFFRAAFVLRKRMPVICGRAVLDRTDDTVPSMKSVTSLFSIPGLVKNYRKAQQSITVLLEELIRYIESGGLSFSAG